MVATPNDPVQKLRQAGVITADPLPAEYEKVLKDANLSGDEIELLGSLSKKLKKAEGAAGKSVSSCFVL
jgi:hypothetical protein